MDAIDNPSYFTLPTETRKKKTGFSFLRRRSDFVKPISGSGSVAGIVASPGHPRKNNKGVTRSVSDNTHLLVLGKPRPSDLAPSVYNATSHRRSATIPGHLISSEDLLHHDMVHCGAVSEIKKNTEFDNSINEPKYYNTSTLACRRFVNTAKRRHSIGSLLQRDHRTTVINILPSAAESNDISKVQLENNFRKRSNNRRISADRVAGKMDDDSLDILLVTSGGSEAACVWVNYLVSCFQQICKEQNKPPFKLLKLQLEDVLNDGFNNQDKCSSARLQIVIVCPLFVQKIQNAISSTESLLSKLLHVDRVVAMLLGVNDLLLDTQLKTALPSFNYWRKMVVKDQDPTFVGDFLGVAMDILSRSWHLKEAINSVEQERAMFSILPKKIKIGQNKLIVLLTDPLNSDDIVKVFVEKNGQRTEIINAKRRNPYTLQFSVPGSCLQVSMLVNIHVEKNGSNLGQRMVKCESRMRELDQLLRSADNPMQFMCQSFGLNTSDKEQLDSFLLTIFQRNLPQGFNLLQPVTTNKYQICNEEYPTLLHFSAKYGLEKLSWQLLESPGGEQACQLRNSSHLVPSEIAERAGHSKLSNALKGYMQMTELSSVYNYLKGLNDKKLLQMDDGNYLLPRPINDTYLIPPAARPVGFPPHQLYSNSAASGPFYENFKPCNFSVLPHSTNIQKSCSDFTNENNYQIPKNGRPCTPQTPRTPTSPNEENYSGYLEMSSLSGNEGSNNFGSVSSFNTHSDFHDNFGSFGKLDSPETSSFHPDYVAASKYIISSHSLSREKVSPEDELLEIINDFKNNVFTISEVEKLVESWQNRNDVQQSFREKQEQLNKMREEYERIQQRMKEQLHRPTPFEKIRKFFSRNKSKHSGNSERTSLSSDTSTNISSHRPPSSISLQSSSSSSSGITSIASGASLSSDTNHNHSHDSKCRILEKQIENRGKKSNVYDEIPQPPKYLNLSTTSDPTADYMQLDCIICKTVNKSINANNSVLSDVIHEGNEMEEGIKITCNVHENPDHYQTIAEIHSPECEKVVIKSGNSVNNSIINKKAKSVENLLSDRECTNISILNDKSTARLLSIDNDKNKMISSDLNIAKKCSDDERRAAIQKSPVKLQIGGCSMKESKSDMSLAQGACESLCAETMKCLTDITCTLATKEESGDEFSCKFEKALNSISSCNISECGSKKSNNSSFDLSSLSSHSSCVVDESNGKDEKCSLVLQITEEGEKETENAPPLENCDDNVFNTYKFPEYVNVSINSPPPLPPRCKYTTVTM